MRPAAFLDRDGTIIEQVHHLTRPEQVRLLDGAAEALCRLADAGFLRVVVTNQSVIGRGMLTIAGLHQVHQRMRQLLARQGADVDAIYFCPAVPGTEDSGPIEDPDRKPGPGMLLRAARDHDLDLGNSWMIGDAVSDALAGRRAGCRGSILVRSGRPLPDDAGFPVVDDLAQAVNLIGREIVSGFATRSSG